MHFSKKKIKEFFGIDILNKHLDDIEGYLDMKSEELKRKKEKKKTGNRERRAGKADSQWIIKTASVKLKRSMRRLSKHM